MISTGIQRPQTLADFVGQPQAIGVLKILLASAKKRGGQLPHVLMSGPPGLGKTSLARIVAHEMGGRLIEAIGGTIKTSGDVAKLLGSLRQSDLVFIDEIYSVPRQLEELFYSVMEDGVLTVEDKSYDRMFKDLGLGATNASSKPVKVLPAFTLVGATTMLGSVSAPLRGRFSSVITLRPYSVHDMACIVSSTAGKMKLAMSNEVANEVARRSKGTARIAVSHVAWLRDYSIANECRLTNAAVQDAFSLRGIDACGMTSTDRAYLEKLLSAGDAVGVETLAATLGESTETLEQTIEPFLLAGGFIEKSPRGRLATAKAKSIMEAVAA